MTTPSAKAIPSIAMTPTVPHHMRLWWPNAKLGKLAASTIGRNGDAAVRSLIPQVPGEPPGFLGAGRRYADTVAHAASTSWRLLEPTTLGRFGTRRPEPDDQRDCDRYRSPDHGPRREDRRHEHHRRRNRSQQRPDGWIWKCEAMMWLRIEERRHEHFRRIVLQPLDCSDDAVPFPQRLTSADHDRRVKVAGGRRRVRCPFQRARIPWIGARCCATSITARDVDDEQQDAENDDRRANRRHEIQRAPARLRGIRVDAARHPLESEDVHRKERDVEADEEEPKVPPAQPVIEHS